MRNGWERKTIRFRRPFGAIWAYFQGRCYVSLRECNYWWGTIIIFVSDRHLQKWPNLHYRQRRYVFAKRNMAQKQVTSECCLKWFKVFVDWDITLKHHGLLNTTCEFTLISPVNITTLLWFFLVTRFFLWTKRGLGQRHWVPQAGCEGILWTWTWVKSAKLKKTRWFKLTFWSPGWRSLNLSKRVTFSPSLKGHQQNHQEHVN